jgi:hypothetical protein
MGAKLRCDLMSAMRRKQTLGLGGSHMKSRTLTPGPLPLLGSCSTGGLAHLSSYERSQGGAQDGSGGSTVLVVVAASATQ